MLTPPDEHVLLLSERWLKLLSDLGRAQATLSAIVVPSAIILRSAASAGSNLKRPGLKTWPPTSALSCPACLCLRPAPRFSCACSLSVSGMSFWFTRIYAVSIRYPVQVYPATSIPGGGWFRVSPVYPQCLMMSNG